MNTFTVTLNKYIKIRVTTRSEAIALGFIIVVWHILALWLGV